jgi:short-subunit dehydrogenase
LKVDVLVNNAGVGVCGDLLKNDWAAEEAMLQLNMLSLTELTKLFLPGMVERKSGKILNIASTAAFQAGPHMALYYATKAYVVSFSEALHEELRGSGVSVTAFCPGPTKTEFDQRARMVSSPLFKSPLVMGAPQAARMGYQAMRTGKPLAFAGFANWCLSFSTRFAPRQLSAVIAGKMNV